MSAISYKAKKLGSGGDWKNLPNAAVKISLGSPQHEGEKLAATLAWVDDRFDHCFICLADTLQRYNLMTSLKDETWAYDAALSAGDAWLSRNAGLINGLKIPHSICRWDNWLSDSRYPEARRAVKEAAESDTAFAKALDLDIMTYLVRRGIGTLSPAYDWKYEQAGKYLMEELAVFSFWQSELHAAEIYPGRSLLVEEQVDSGAIRSLPSLKNRSKVKLGLLRRTQALVEAVPS